MILLYPIILIALCTRCIQWRFFMKKISKICYLYDKSFVFGKDHIPELIAINEGPQWLLCVQRVVSLLLFIPPRSKSVCYINFLKSLST